LSELHVSVDGRTVSLDEGWELAWSDEGPGIARMRRDGRTELIVVEGAGSDWFVTVRGRRIPVAVRTRREQLLAEAEVARQAHGGPIDVRATLPGLVVAVSAEVGAQVAEGDPLLTIEAMKMQNEVRAPRQGTVGQIVVAAGQTVATGALLLRLE